MKWTIFWSSGPADNPKCGEFEVIANSFPQAHAAAIAELNGDNYIDGIIRNDVMEDMS
jgi:hypothetical protein